MFLDRTPGQGSTLTDPPLHSSQESLLSGFSPPLQCLGLELLAERNPYSTRVGPHEQHNQPSAETGVEIWAHAYDSLQR